MGLHSGWGCTRNLPDCKKGECRFSHREGDEVAHSEVLCARFLKQSREMGEIGCNYCHSVEQYCNCCHTKHATDLKIVRDPNSCAKCHMGPGCQSCHMPEGSHKVSIGMTMNSGGVPYPPQNGETGRAEMLKLCSGCHAPVFARREMERGALTPEGYAGEKARLLERFK
jgi:hypothetical protein